MIENIIISFISAILGVVIALIFDREKFPKLEIDAAEEANSDNNYPSNGRWKFFRLKIGNRKVHSLFNWLLVRQTAEGCRAVIYIEGIDNETKFSFKGRWASTPELPHLSSDEAFKKLMYYPDPVTILPESYEFLDVFVKPEDDVAAYGWNNESYLRNWKNENYRLAPGKYSLKVVITTQNGISATEKFKIIIDNEISNTSLI